MVIMYVSLLVWRTRYTDTFCNAVDCRFELVLEVQRWTRARSECLPGGGGKHYSYATVQRYSLGGSSSDAAVRCQYCSSLLERETVRLIAFRRRGGRLV